MGYEFQVVVDCADPHTQADWWAEALGWEVEPQDEDFIRTMVAQGHASEDDTTTHRGKLVWKIGTAIRHPERPRVLFQLVPEAKTVKNRLHLDIRVGDERRAAEVERLTELGAKPLHEGRQGPFSWVTMADPEGNEFCVA
ncbi:Glyoxalase-like domain [Nocardia otitidiscaviarum]|uniref:Glyoxalase-like domain n=1 Tax=Nocardia otitidiscaviarum TaxID=1823 RepID=A0A378YUA3_9NOCA|nr:VOC family protein [Nocardia otitidiscaviarum]MBF6181211.1 VOC family protein [Nocardia otitidiscaviarum]SUA80378.1 Glyoxalase-like domain [Nocardia otitidiscaviarum]